MDGSAPIDMFSSLKPGWNEKNKRGRAFDQRGIAPGNKRKLAKQKMEVSDANSGTDDPPAYLEKGKAAMDSTGESNQKHGRVLLSYSLHKDKNSCQALVPAPEVKGLQDEEKRMQEDFQQQTECKWCKKGFANRYTLAVHLQFCHQKHVPMRVNQERMRPAAPGRNFDLNLKPAEAWVAKNRGIIDQGGVKKKIEGKKMKKEAL